MAKRQKYTLGDGRKMIFSTEKFREELHMREDGVKLSRENQIKCPVCKTECVGCECCSYCGFNQLNKTFVDKDDANNWYEEVIEPYYMCFETKKLIERWLRYIILNHEGEIGEKAAGKFSKGICNLKLFEEEYYGGKSFDDYELKRDKLFANGKDWHDIVKFVNIINSVDDYKLLTFILLYKMRTQHNILCDEFREFFIIICERIITITQKVLSTYNE